MRVRTSLEASKVSASPVGTRARKTSEKERKWKWSLMKTERISLMTTRKSLKARKRASST